MKSRLPIFSLLLVPFLDYVGVGMIFPLLPFLLFQSPMLPAEMGEMGRAMWMGVLVALGPLVQFFASPILGALSDQKGRKQMLSIGLSVGLFAYLIGVFAVWVSSFLCLLLYRVLFGISAATMPVVQAAIVDLSGKEEKAKNFSLYNMALGFGFAIGPFLGGQLSNSSWIGWFDYSTPFMACALAVILNLFLLRFHFKETAPPKRGECLEVFRGLRQMRLAYSHPVLKWVFLAIFLYCFGWDYFVQFCTVTLIGLFDFTAADAGWFYAYMGLAYALCNAWIVPRILKRISTEKALLFSLLSGGGWLLLLGFASQPWVFLAMMLVLAFILSLFYPVASIYISDAATEDTQGELLGVYQSVQSLGLVIAPLFLGSLSVAMPRMPIYLGGSAMVMGGIVFLLYYLRQHQFAQNPDEPIDPPAL